MNTEKIDMDHPDNSDSKIIPFVQPASRSEHKRRKPRADHMSSGAWVISDETRVALERCELLFDLDRNQLMAIAALVEEFEFEPNEILIKEGHPAAFIFVITKGHAIAQIETEHGWLSLGSVGPGETAGWSSLIDSKVYPASVRSLTEIRVARIDADGLRLLLNLEPEIGYPVHKRLSAIFCRQYEAALKALKSA